MSQDMRGEVGIVLLQAPFSGEELCANGSKINFFGFISGCKASHRKPGEKKISELALSKVSLLWEVLSSWPHDWRPTLSPYS